MPVFDHDPTHKSKALLSNQVLPFFEELEESFRGRPVRIARGSGMMRPPEQLPAYTLESLKITRKRQKDTLVIGTAEADPKTVRVVLVWVTWNADGQVVGIEITDNKTQKMQLYF